MVLLLHHYFDFVLHSQSHLMIVAIAVVDSADNIVVALFGFGPAFVEIHSKYFA